MRVATYLRVSTGLQTVENQRLEIERHVTAKGWTMFREHADEGASGATTRRPALDQLMADARRRRFDGVCVAKLDRFGRSLKDLVLTLEELQSLRHALQWNDGQPQFVETKTKQSKRVIALANRVASALQLHRKTQLEARLKAGDKWSDRGLVFCTRTGGPLQALAHSSACSERPGSHDGGSTICDTPPRPSFYIRRCIPAWLRIFSAIRRSG
jgi:Resolvase, N terminal domain